MPTLTDFGEEFRYRHGWGLTILIAAPPNGSSVWVGPEHKIHLLCVTFGEKTVDTKRKPHGTEVAEARPVTG